jgi:MFS family permease
MKDQPANPRYAWTIVGFLWLALLLNYMDRQLVFSMFPVLKSEIGFSGAQLGLIGSVFIWTYCLCQGPAGWLADVLPKGRMIIASLTLWSAATLGTGLSHSIFGILCWRAVMGITESLYMPAALALIAGMHPVATRSRALAVHGTAQLLGGVAGGWYGGWMTEHFGWRTGFLILSVAGVGYAFILAIAFRGLPHLPRAGAPVLGSLYELLRSKSYVALIVAFVFFGVLLWMLYTWLPTHIYEHYHLNLADSGLIATLYLQSSSAVGIVSGGVLADWSVKRIRSGRLYIVAVGVLASAPFAYFTLAVNSISLLKTCAAAFGFFAGLLITNIFSAAYDVVTPSTRGLAAGVLNSIPGMASGTAVFLAGSLKESFGLAHLMSYGVTAAAAGGVLLVGVTKIHFAHDHLLSQKRAHFG